MKRALACAVLLFSAVFLLSSCATDSSVLKPGYDFSGIKRVAVLDFNDYPSYRMSGSMISEIFVKYFLQSGYNVIERNELDKILEEQKLSTSRLLDPATVKAIGKISGVDALVIGSITTFNQERDFYEHGNPRFIAAQVGITCRMFSVETGEVLWVASGTYDGMNTQTASEYLISSLVRQFRKDAAKKVR